MNCSLRGKKKTSCEFLEVLFTWMSNYVIFLGIIIWNAFAWVVLGHVLGDPRGN
jgi:hypothetical protein